MRSVCRWPGASALGGQGTAGLLAAPASTASAHAATVLFMQAKMARDENSTVISTAITQLSSVDIGLEICVHLYIAPYLFIIGIQSV